MPHLLVTAGNDQHLRIWDTRHLLSISPKSVELLTPPDSATDHSDTAAHFETHPTSSVGYEKVGQHLNSAKGKGLLRASFQHGKSCSAAYWDPWGRRVLSTSYDDRLRGELPLRPDQIDPSLTMSIAVWTLNPQSMLLDAPLAPSHFQPSRTYPHNCQTGRWLTILRAQWSLNMDYIPHFTVFPLPGSRRKGS